MRFHYVTLLVLFFCCGERQAYAQSVAYPLVDLKDKRLLLSVSPSFQLSETSITMRNVIHFGIEAYRSDAEKQNVFTLDFDITRYDGIYRDFSSPINFAVRAGVDRTYFFRSQLFFSFGSSLRIHQTEHLDRTSYLPQISIGIGKGRIDRVNERMFVEMIVKLLTNDHELSKEEDDDINVYVRNLKNERTFYNVGSIEDELQEIADYLALHEITRSSLDSRTNTQLIHKYYKFLPSLERTDGKSFGLRSSISTTYSNFVGEKFYNIRRILGNVGLVLFYQDDSYMSHKFQLNKRGEVTVNWLENYDRGYAITETFTIETTYLPDMSTAYSLSAGAFNRYHTLSEFFRYGVALGGTYRKALSQRVVIYANVLGEIDLNENILGYVNLKLNF